MTAGTGRVLWTWTTQQVLKDDSSCLDAMAMSHLSPQGAIKSLLLTCVPPPAQSLQMATQQVLQED